MSADNIEAARGAFAKFERDMAQSSAGLALQEALDYALDIIAESAEDYRNKKVAENLIETYRKKLEERIKPFLKDAGSFDYDHYEHWISLTRLFIDSGCDKDKTLYDVGIELLAKSFRILSREEREGLRRHLERDSESK
jgi:hypothetical protein